MINLLNYFNKAYCINLDSSSERWGETKKEFDKWGITGVDRFSAINGESIDSENNLKQGELGVLYSNLEIIKDAKKNNYDNVLIFEDDVFFSNEILNLETYLENLPDDWHLFYMGGMQIGGELPKIISDNIIKINNTLMIHAIAVNHKMYDIILDELPYSEIPIDTYYTGFQKRFPCYCTNPYIAFQRPGMSDIQNHYKPHEESYYSGITKTN